MNKLLQALLTLFLFTLIFAGCSSPSLRIQSTPPGAQVYAAQQISKERILIGVTPFEISFKDLYEKKTGSTQSSGEYLIVTLEAKGLEPERVLVPPLSYGTSTLNIKVIMSPRQDVKNAAAILQRLHNAQKFAQSGQLERAQIEVDKALESDPQFVRSISMKASIYYLQKNYTEATSWFEKALIIDSSFDEAIKMLARIKEEKK